MTLRLGISTCPNDTFAFHGLLEHRVDLRGLDLRLECMDIQELNERAMRGELEVSAVSIHAYAYLADRYLLLPHGASMGEGYGPRLVASRQLSEAEIRRATVAVPGELTSAYLALHLWAPDVRTVVVPFDRILDAVRQGEAEVGLLIHEAMCSVSVNLMPRPKICPPAPSTRGV